MFFHPQTHDVRTGRKNDSGLQRNNLR